MKDSEKVNWLGSLVVIWLSWLLTWFICTEVALYTGDVEPLKSIGPGWVVPTIVYLLILSWRAAYLKGREKVDVRRAQFEVEELVKVLNGVKNGKSD